MGAPHFDSAQCERYGYQRLAALVFCDLCGSKKSRFIGLQIKPHCSLAHDLYPRHRHHRR